MDSEKEQKVVDNLYTKCYYINVVKNTTKTHKKGK